MKVSFRISFESILVMNQFADEQVLVVPITDVAVPFAAFKKGDHVEVTITVKKV